MAKKFQLSALPAAKTAKVVEPAPELPVARVVLDTPVPHLAREFDYLVPATLHDAAQPGVRVKVRFGSQDLAGFITARAAEPVQTDEAHPQLITLADLVPLKKVVSPEPVLKPEVLALARAVADYYGGTLPDVLRFAIPPRHARAEAAPPPTSVILREPVASQKLPAVNLRELPRSADAGSQAPFWQRAWLPAWSQYQNGPEFLTTITNPAAPITPAVPVSSSEIEQPQPHCRKYVWTSLPGLAAPKPPETVPHLPLWAAQIAATTAACQQASGGGVLIVAPDVNDVNRIVEALELASVPNVVRLLAEDGPEERYRAFLAAERGVANVVVGTRSAAFAPIANLRLMVLWGDGDSSLVEQHSPQFDARVVLGLRSAQQGVPLLVGSVGRTVAVQAWVEADEAISLEGYREVLRSRAPLVRIIDSAATADEGYLARMPTVAQQGVRQALEHGPVLVQVPLTGYLPRFECQNCRTPARCARCGGPLALTDAEAAPSCRACGQLAPGWRCANCGSSKIRAGKIGADRTAVELARAFPGVQIIVSTATAPGGVKASLPRPRRPGLVIATPGAEPVVPGGYAAALILDAGVTTARVTLDMAVEALRRWLTVAHLVVPAAVGGRVFLVGDADPNATAALVRLAPVWLADRELTERAIAGLPPTTRMAEITGDAAAVDAVLARLPLATEQNTLGPVPLASAPAIELPSQTGRFTTSIPVVPGPGAEAQPGALATEALGEELPQLFTEPQVKVLLRVPRAQGVELAEQLRASLAVRSAKREPGQLKAVLDPTDFA